METIEKQTEDDIAGEQHTYAPQTSTQYSTSGRPGRKVITCSPEKEVMYGYISITIGTRHG